jgi:biopolymer transport protein ExbB
MRIVLESFRLSKRASIGVMLEAGSKPHGDCLNFSESARKNRTVPLFATVLNLLLVMFGAFSPIVLDAQLAAAQQENDVVPDEEVIDDVAEDVAPADPMADDSTNATAANRPRRSYLGWLWEALGPLYSIIFLSLSFALVAVFVMCLLMARRESILPSTLIDGFEASLNAKKYQEAYELAKNDESFLGKVLSAGLARLSSGYPQAVEAMQEVGEEENMRLEHRLSYLALIGTISPMFGLLGTVDGMVQAFEVIARSAVSPKPAELADGIATALVTTLIGLWLAIPAIAAFNILRNHVARLVLEVGIVSENLMSRFQNVGNQKTP